jgi:hypothetical protein
MVVEEGSAFPWDVEARIFTSGVPLSVEVELHACTSLGCALQNLANGRLVCAQQEAHKVVLLLLNLLVGHHPKLGGREFDLLDAIHLQEVELEAWAASYARVASSGESKIPSSTISSGGWDCGVTELI